MPPSSPGAVDALAAVSTLRPFEDGAARWAAPSHFREHLTQAHCKPLSSQYTVGFFFYDFWMYLLALSVNADRQRYNLKATAFVKQRSWTPTYCHLKNHHCGTAVQRNSIQPAQDTYGKAAIVIDILGFFYIVVCVLEVFKGHKSYITGRNRSVI